MSEPKDWPLLARYLSGECSKEEKEKIEMWISSDLENQILIKRMKIMWQIPQFKTESSDVKKLWIELVEKAGIENKSDQTQKIIKFPFVYKIEVDLSTKQHLISHTAEWDFMNYNDNTKNKSIDLNNQQNPDIHISTEIFGIT